MFGALSYKGIFKVFKISSSVWYFPSEDLAGKAAVLPWHLSTGEAKSLLEKVLNDEKPGDSAEQWWFHGEFLG